MNSSSSSASFSSLGWERVGISPPVTKVQTPGPEGRHHPEPPAHYAATYQTTATITPILLTGVLQSLRRLPSGAQGRLELSPV